MQTNSRWLCVILIVFAPLKTMRGCSGEQVNLTNSIDYLIPYISEYMVDKKMDPLNISDVHQSFCVTDLLFFPPPICIGLKYSLSSGLLYHLSQIKRRGPVIVTMKDGLLTIDSNLSLDRISMSFKYLLELLFLRQRGRSVIEADSISANIGFTVNVSSCKFAFNKFKLTNVGLVKVTSKDNGLISRLIVIVANVVLNFMKDTLIASLEAGSNTALREAFKEMNEAPCPWSPLSLFRTMYNLLYTG